MTDNIEIWLKSRLKESRFIHSLNVRDCAVKLAQNYNCEVEKANLAGLLHDCAKNMPPEELMDFAKSHNMFLDDIKIKAPELLHADVGAVIAREEFNVSEDIEKAIKYHTTGCENMPLLAKIIYISDLIEPSREITGIDEIREIVYKDINKALIMSMDMCIKYVISKNGLLHPDTINARNYLL